MVIAVICGGRRVCLAGLVPAFVLDFGKDF